MERDPVRVMVIEEDPVLRALIAARLRRGNCGEVETPDPARWFERACETRPDVVLIDLTSDDGDALESIPELVASCPRTMVAALTTRPAHQAEAETRDAGAFVLYEKRNAVVKRLAEYVRGDLALFHRALRGESASPPPCHTRRRQAVSDEWGHRSPPRPLGGVTRREAGRPGA